MSFCFAGPWADFSKTLQPHGLMRRLKKDANWKPLPYTQCLMRVVSVHFHRCGHILAIPYTRLDEKGQKCSTHATVPENGYVFLYFAAVHITFK
jgi:hypothetical protein